MLVPPFAWGDTTIKYSATTSGGYSHSFRKDLFLGIFSLFTRMSGGLWLMLIGWFLYTAAQTSYQQSTLQESLSGIKVKDVMVRDIVSLSPLISIDEAVNAYFLRYGYGGFPVFEGEKFLGIVTLTPIFAEL